MKVIKYIIFAIFAIGCTHQQTAVKLNNQTISDALYQKMEIPAYANPEVGRALKLEVGDGAPFSGILLDKDKAIATGQLRIAYNDLYQTMHIYKSAYDITLRTLEDELDKSEIKIHELETEKNSWLQRHKLSVGIVSGILVGIAGCVGGVFIVEKLGN